MRDTRKTSSRTTPEIEALLREQAADEVRTNGRGISGRVMARLRADGAGRATTGRMRIGRPGADDERVPRWFLAAAGIGIAALAGWLVFAPNAGGPQGAGKRTDSPIATNERLSLPSPDMFDGSAQRLLSWMIKPQDDRMRREARALVGAGWELAGRVLGGIPIELVKPVATEQRESS